MGSSFHDLFHLKPDGILAIILPHGVLFRGGEEGNIRKNLIEQNHIDTIIGLPANIFFGTGIPTIIMVLKQQRDNTDVLIVDASKGFAKEGTNNILRARDIKRIVDVVTSRTTVEKFSKVVSRDDIRANDYNLNIPRYVDSSEKAESWDIFASMFDGVPENELQELNTYWSAFPDLKEALFVSDNGSYYHLNVTDLKSTILSHTSVVSFLNHYKETFSDFGNELSHELLDNMQSLNIAQKEAVLSNAIFSRLSGIPLVDRYDAYQLLDDEWKKIAVDLEIIQTEGFNATRQVAPNMVSKKKNGKDQEVQEGWVGHIIPFSLVQESLLSDDLTNLTKQEARLAEISSEYEGQLEELSEEDKEQDFINESKDAFVSAEVKKALKAKEAEPQTLAVLKKVNELITEEKMLKQQIKGKYAELDIKTKEVIKELSDDEIRELLQKKWITPIINGLCSLPNTVLAEFIDKLEAICNKYETTFADVEEEIADTEASLISLMDNLTGGEFDMKGLAEFKKLLRGE